MTKGEKGVWIILEGQTLMLMYSLAMDLPMFLFMAIV